MPDKQPALEQQPTPTPAPDQQPALASDQQSAALSYAPKWASIDWDAAEAALQEYQMSLSKLAYARRMGKVARLQKKMTDDELIKALAVRYVADNMGHPGLDNARWDTDEACGMALACLNAGRYTAKPSKSYQAFQHGKMRSLSMPCASDRAMQKLYSYALAPVLEALADRKSFAFRAGRSSLDAHAYLCDMLEKNHDAWVVVTDVQSYYNTINHQWLIDHTPMDTHVLSEFIRAGHVMNGSLFPTEQGISLGFSISPLLGNMVLDGLQEKLFAHFSPSAAAPTAPTPATTSTPAAQPDYTQGNMLRFADDIVVTTHTYQDAQAALQVIRDFVAERGLRLSEDKTYIHHISQGITMLSRTYRLKNDHIAASPSQEAVEQLEQQLETIILLHKGSQRRLIEKVNRKLSGWAAYHRVADGYDAFCRIDSVVQAYLLRLCQSKHPALPTAKVIARYWYKDARGDYYYACDKKPDLRIIHIADTIPVTHKPVSINKNPYLDLEYFRKRAEQQGMLKVSARYKALWKRQQGKCFYCEQPILLDQERSLVVLDPTKDEGFNNHAYVHATCVAGGGAFFARGSRRRARRCLSDFGPAATAARLRRENAVAL